MEYFRSVVKELGNVKFPAKDEVKLTAIAIVLILIVMMIFIGFADFIISKLIKTLLGIL
jgi:preprotein translocase SecE subunit